MAFRFSLEGVLRVRESLERLEEIALYKIAQEIAAAELDLQQLETRQLTIREQRDMELTKGFPAIHLQEIAEEESRFMQAAEALRVLLRNLEGRRLAQLEVYRKAQQNRAVLSEMRKQQRHSYQRQQRRQEQKTLDDLFLSRIKSRD